MIDYSQIKDFHEGKISEAIGCGVPEIDGYLRFKRNFTVIGGIGNVGKTTSWMYILFLWAKLHPHKLKFLLFLNENDPVEMAVQMIEWIGGEQIHRLNRMQVARAIEWMNHHFNFLDNDYKSSLDALLNKFILIKKGERNAVLNPDGLKFDYDGVFIDPYNSLPVYKGYIEHYENATKFRKFVGISGAKVMVSMHPSTEAQRRRDENGHTSVPHLVDLEMGSMWFNRCDDGVIFHRQIQDETLKYITELHVQKIKNKRTGGQPTPHDQPIKMVWDNSKAGRFMFTESGDVVSNIIPTQNEIF